jgi:hypothetical protein
MFTTWHGKEDTRYSHAMSVLGTTESNVSKIMLEIPHFSELKTYVIRYHIYTYAMLKLRIFLFTRRKRAMCTCICINIERNFEGHRRGFDILKKFNIGIVIINRHDCWTFIMAYQAPKGFWHSEKIQNRNWHYKYTWLLTIHYDLSHHILCKLCLCPWYNPILKIWTVTTELFFFAHWCFRNPLFCAR